MANELRDFKPVDTQVFKINPGGEDQPGRIERALVYLPVLLGLGVYLAMLPTQITLANWGEDGGDLLSAALTGGIPHPTGYPTYQLLLRAIQLIPVGDVFWRGSLLSAMCAALTVGLLSAWIVHCQPRGRAGRIGALAGGMALAFAPLFWSQAVIIEVQTLHAFFVVLMLWWITLLVEAGPSTRLPLRLALLALAGGLGTGNHLTILFAVPVVLAAAWRARRNGLAGGWLAVQAGAFVLGCLVYVYLPLAASRNPPVNWGDPQTLAGFWWLISGAPYQAMVFGLPIGQILGRIVDWARLLVVQFTLPVLITTVLGWRLRPTRSKILRWGLIWIFAVYSLFYFGYSSRDAAVYLIAPWIVVSIWIGDGVARLLEIKLANFAFGVFTTLVVCLCLLARIPLAWSSVDPSRDKLTVQYLDEVNKLLPKKALLFTSGDQDTFPLWYTHLGLGQRPDLRIVVPALTAFKWYRVSLHQTYPDLVLPSDSEDNSWSQLLVQLNPDRPDCQSKLSTDSELISISCEGKTLLTTQYFYSGNGSFR